MKKLWACLLVLALVTAACGDTGDDSSGGGGGSGGGGDADPGVIRVLHSQNSEQLAIFVAQEAGLFEEHGLKVELEEAGGAGQITPAIAGGTGDMGLSTATDLLLAQQEGLDLVFAAGGSVNTPENPRLFLVAGADSGIVDASDMDGRRVAVPSRGSFAELGIGILLEEEGVDPDSIDWVEMPFPQMNDALDERVVDAAVAVVPFTDLMERGGHTKLVDASDLGDDVLIAVLSARRDWAEDHTDEIVEFRAALADAADLIAEDPDFAKKVEAQYTGLPPDVVKTIPFSTFQSKVSVESVELWIDILEQQDLIEPGTDAASLVVPPPT